MSDPINLQDAILNEVRRDKVPVTLFLMNGFQLRGTVTGFDSFVVVLVSVRSRPTAVLCVIVSQSSRRTLKKSTARWPCNAPIVVRWCVWRWWDIPTWVSPR